MIPVVSLVGRPNVGKSTLFNQLTRSRAALVADFPGLTRDRQYGECRIGERRMILIDTGGIGESVSGEIDAHVTDQARQAVLESDLVFFLVDAQVGLTATDEALARDLRVAGKKIFLVVNKADGREADTVLVDFHRLGFEHVFAIAAAHNRGITPLVAAAHTQFPAEETDTAYDVHRGIKMAVVGRPNVGKSTLVNRMLGEERVVVFDMPGTTRDSIYIDYERDGKAYTLIDTAGVRRRGSIDLAVEKFSIVKTLQAISDANVVMLVMDASEGVVDQDLHLMGHVIDVGKALVIVVNKWDGLTPDHRESVRRNLDRKLSFIDYADIHMVSALHGSGVGKLYDSIRKAYASATQDLKTPILTRILEEAVITHQPPLVNGRRIKMRYAHAGGANPPIIIIHGSQVENTPKNYVRFLEKTFREKLKLAGTPIRIEFRTGDNPYAGKRNMLTERQVAKKRRLMKHVKKHR